MPYSMTERLGPYERRDLGEGFAEEPQWWMAAGISGALLVATVGVATFLFSRDHVSSPVTLGVLLALAVAPFILQLFVSRLISPLWSLGALAVLHLGGSPLGLYDPIHGRDQVSLMILVWLVGGTAAVGQRREIVFVTAAAVVIVIGRGVTDAADGGSGIWLVAVVLGLMAGLFIRSLTVALLNTKLAQAALAEQATTAERQRIAREVHDVIAHSLTVTMLHLTAARLAVGRGDSTAATEALEEAEKAGRTSLNEIRHTVGLLRSDDGELGSAPQPSATDVPALVKGYRSAGLNASLDVQGDLDSVEPATGLALYRIVQESLTNAGRHAPGGRSTVSIDIGPPLRIDVLTRGCGTLGRAGSGSGLIGMAERAAALGGQCDAGPERNGWRVAATLP